MSKMGMRTMLAVAIASSVPQATQAQAAGRSFSAQQVERFRRPADMRIPPPAGAPSGPDVRRATQACPATLDDMCKNFWAFAGQFLRINTIPTRDRELLTLRTAWLSRGEYIWASHHDSYATKAGVTAEEVKRVTEGPNAQGWSAFDSTLLRAADELHANRFISEDTWRALGERYTDRQRVEAVLTVAAYTSLAMYFNSTGAQMEQGRTGLPE